MSGRNKKNLIRPILFLYYEESLVSSNLNSNLLRFHCVRPNVHTAHSDTAIQKYLFDALNVRHVNDRVQSLY